MLPNSGARISAHARRGLALAVSVDDARHGLHRCFSPASRAERFGRKRVMVASLGRLLARDARAARAGAELGGSARVARPDGPRAVGPAGGRDGLSRRRDRRRLRSASRWGFISPARRSAACSDGWTVGFLADHRRLAARARRDRRRSRCSAPLYFISALPRERAVRAEARRSRRARPDAARGHFRDAGLRLLFAVGFLVMGAFVCTYNYYRLPARRAAVLAERDGRRLRVPALSGRRGEFDRHGRSRRPVRPPARAVDRARRSASSARPSRCRIISHALFLGARAADLGFLRRAFDRLELGRLAGQRGQGAGGGALSVLLLSRLERDRLGGRAVLSALGLERRRGADRRAVGVGARASPGGSPMFRRRPPQKP